MLFIPYMKFHRIVILWSFYKNKSPLLIKNKGDRFGRDSVLRLGITIYALNAATDRIVSRSFL